MSTAYKTARILLRRGQPLPVDLTYRLLAEGIDVSKLEARHGQ